MDTAKQQNEQSESVVNHAHKTLAEIYNQRMPETLKGYQEGVRAGIRYALIATGQKVDGIHLEMEEGKYSERTNG